jgi:hypothetical protein
MPKYMMLLIKAKALLDKSVLDLAIA